MAPPGVAPPPYPLPMSSQRKLEALQVLRALAAAAVMVFHGAELLEARAGGAFLGWLCAPGHHGVDVFFVLSGFIILYTSARVRGPREFLTRRCIRLFPVYWVVTALLVAAYLLTPSPEMAHKADPGVIAKSLLLLPAPRHVVGVAWTLVYEVWFYLLFGLLYFRSRGLFYAALGGWSALAWSAPLWLAGSAPFALSFLFHPIVSEFLLGCLAAELFVRSQGHAARTALALGGAGFVAAWALEANGLVFSRVLAFGLPSTLLVYGAASLRVRWPHALVYLGDASYSLYLVHATAISILLKLAGSLGWLPAVASVAGNLALYAATLAGATLFHRWIEAPLLAVCRRRWLRRPAEPDVAGDPLPA